MLRPRRFLIPLLTLLIAAPAAASDAIEQRLAEVVPTVAPDAIEPTAIPGLFEVRYGADVFYVSEDGRYLLQGSLIDLETRKNLTEETRQQARADVFSEIPDSELTVYVPEREVRHVMNVFTDPNCPYCRRQHQEMQTYLDAGVKVRYFMFPVLGRESPDVMRNIWCADDRNAAMDLAKEGKPVPEAHCDTPADEHLALGRELGISGTPATITDSGHQISGYRPAIEIIQTLNSAQ
ncbi:DsbC family protein [Thioalkalivibrio paradoxus]|uniref:Thiol:disulfide interchange protein n=1 Tax=Thioalkalivibrio paradoxus ARh 1 TaxID=713585 RepID=W0DQ27_9GAMM|nr:DsbC family protein [Thioalkalivibrio paradoxus]AHE99103.1 disulfide bond formation protein DsbC [Thioalkalivibrio paradoxus ARh 1]